VLKISGQVFVGGIVDAGSTTNQKMSRTTTSCEAPPFRGPDLSCTV
jgi:hypothetical protein